MKKHLSFSEMHGLFADRLYELTVGEDCAESAADDAMR